MCKTPIGRLTEEVLQRTLWEGDGVEQRFKYLDPTDNSCAYC